MQKFETECKYIVSDWICAGIAYRKSTGDVKKFIIFSFDKFIFLYLNVFDLIFFYNLFHYTYIKILLR